MLRNMLNIGAPVLLISGGIDHPALLARHRLRQALEALPGYRFRRFGSLEALVGLRLDAYRAMILYYHEDDLSAAALDALDSFLRGGGGVLALHSASASFGAQPRYRDLLGGHFVSHGPIEYFEVQPAAEPDEIFGGIPAFTVRDELYRHEWDASNSVHFTTLVDGEREPVVWTRRVGAGRLCYCALGHVPGTWRRSPVRAILGRGLAWVCRQ